MRIILIVLVMMQSMHGHFEARCAVLSVNSVVTTHDITCIEPLIHLYTYSQLQTVTSPVITSTNLWDVNNCKGNSNSF